MQIRQKVPFVLASCEHGTVILNRLDWRPLSATHNEFGVGTDILINGNGDRDLLAILCGMLETRRDAGGPGVMALDCGANIGTYTLEFGRAMEGWGMVLAFEPQERIFYALAGNIAINNLFNAKAFNRAVGRAPGTIDIPVVDYQIPGQFGGFQLKGDGSSIGQKTDERTPVEVISIDAMKLARVDLLKADVEGMELDVLEGARETIERSRPYILAEHHICGKQNLEIFLDSIGYENIALGFNLLAAPRGDETFGKLRGYLAKRLAA